MSRRILIAAVIVAALAPAAPCFAQNEAALRSYFEGRKVTLKIDMPATLDGVDLKLGTEKPLDAREYGNRLKSFGTAIHAGETVVVTLVHMKKDLIEFQLAGGGFGHDTGSVSLPTVSKSNREKDLENKVKAEPDPKRKKELQNELDDVKSARDRENERIHREELRQQEQNKARIAVERLRAGSRFNLRYPKIVPDGVKPADIMEALAEYVDFSGSPAPSMRGTTPPPSPAPGQPRKGMLVADAEKEFGRAVTSTDRREGTLTVTTMIFVHGEQRISAEFVEGVLIKYTISSR